MNSELFSLILTAYKEDQNPLKLSQIFHFSDNEFLDFLQFMLTSKLWSEVEKWRFLSRFYEFASRAEADKSPSQRETQTSLKKQCREFMNFTAECMVVTSNIDATEKYAKEWMELKTTLLDQIKKGHFDFDKNKLSKLNEMIQRRRKELINEGSSYPPEMGS